MPLKSTKGPGINRYTPPADPGGPVTEWLVTRIPLGPKTRVLEIAAGSGTVTFAAAGRAREGAFVCTDLNVGAVMAAARHHSSSGIAERPDGGPRPSITFLAADMLRLPFSAAVFDAALCRMGFMFTADPVVAFGEARRVLRSGGRLAFAVWAAPEQNPWQSHLDDALTAHGVEDRSAQRRSGGMFSLADQAALQRSLQETGLSLVELAGVEVPRSYASFDEYWAMEVDVGPDRPRRLRALDQGDLSAFRAGLEAALLPYREERGYRIPGLSLAVVALA